MSVNASILKQAYFVVLAATYAECNFSHPNLERTCSVESFPTESC